MREGSLDSPRTVAAIVAALRGRDRAPAIIALRKEGADEWSSRQLGETAERVARGLARRGVGDDAPVALFADNRPEWMAAALGICAAGGAVMPLDVQFGDEPLRHALHDGKPRLVLATANRLERLAAMDLDAEILVLDEEAGERSWRQLLADDGDLPQVDADARAALFYTSGTTGPPKGVPLTHANLASQFGPVRDADIVTSGDRALLPLPMHHVYPFVMGMLVPLHLGVPIVLPHALTGPEIVRAIREGEVTVVIGVPRLYGALYDGIARRAQSAGRVAGVAFEGLLAASKGLRRVGIDAGRQLFGKLHARTGASLRLLASGGAPLAADLERNLAALGWDVAIGYGLTETSPLLALRLPEDDVPGSVGRPIAGVELRIDREAERAQGDYGEIVARGPNVFAGYHDLPEKTAEALSEDGWFRTGDLGRIDGDGFLHLVGRTSEMIVTEGGENIQPEHVEDAYRAHPALRELGVLQSDGRLVAVIVPEAKALQGREDRRRAIDEALAERGRALPSYQRVADFALTDEALPRTRLGKLRRHLLPERFAQAREGKERTGPVAIEELSGDDRALLEHSAARATWDLLVERFPDQPLTPDKSLQLDLGIDSLEWVNLTLEIAQRAGLELTEEAIAEVETVRDLLREVSQAGEGAAPDLAREPERALGARQRRWLEPLSPAAAAVSRALHTLDRLALRTLFRLRVSGAERIAGQRQVVFSPNHTSLLDPFALAAALDRPRIDETYWGGWVGVAFNNPLVRAGSRLSRTVPVDPDRGPLSTLAFAAAVLKRGKSLVWFPEGARSPDGTLQPLKPGLGIVLDAQPVPIVPVHIAGTRDALPPGRMLPRPRAVTVTFGAPVDPAQLVREGEGDGERERLLDALARRIKSLT